MLKLRRSGTEEGSRTRNGRTQCSPDTACAGHDLSDTTAFACMIRCVLVSSVGESLRKSQLQQNTVPDTKRSERVVEERRTKTSETAGEGSSGGGRGLRGRWLALNVPTSSASRISPSSSTPHRPRHASIPAFPTAQTTLSTTTALIGRTVLNISTIAPAFRPSTQQQVATLS